MIHIKNERNERNLNLGCKGGHMLNFNAGETKAVPEEVANLFEREIEYYIENNFLSIQKVASNPTVTNEFKEDAPVVETTTKRKTRKSIKE